MARPGSGKARGSDSAEGVRAQRLAAQCLSARAATPRAAVERLLAVQGQDLHQARRAVALRAANGTTAAVDQAFAKRQLVRSWLMRGTLHVVVPSDLPWLTALFAARNLARAASRLRKLGIGADDLSAARGLTERALARGPADRNALFAALEAGGQPVKEQRGIHLLFALSQAGVLCQAGQAFALVEQWVGPTPALSRDEALARLAQRYLRGHGPATADDLAYWAGLGKREAARALELAGALEAPQPRAPVPPVLLLPGYDEYLLGYAARAWCLEARFQARVVPGGNGVYLPLVVLGGEVRGTWRRGTRGEALVSPFTPFSAAERRAVEHALEAGAGTGEAPTQLSLLDAADRR